MRKFLNMNVQHKKNTQAYISAINCIHFHKQLDTTEMILFRQTTSWYPVITDTIIINYPVCKLLWYLKVDGGFNIVNTFVSQKSKPTYHIYHICTRSEVFVYLFVSIRWASLYRCVPRSTQSILHRMTIQRTPLNHTAL